MHSVPALVAAALGVMVLASGCGQQHQGTPAGPPQPVSATAAPLPAPVPGDPGTATCGSATPPISLITITYADNGRTLCVRRGTAVQVYLSGTPANRWMAIHASGDALVPHAHGRLMLKPGMTGASFLAAHPGTATITSIREPCGPGQTPGNTGAQSGTLECGVIIAFHATVKVT
jgi:hypothetical protein